ncbi:MAG: sterol desaturase family protein [Verrucomicrobiota bacterium]
MKDQPIFDRNSRGEWQPVPLPEPGRLFAWPWNPWNALKSLWATLWAYNYLYIAMAVVSWLYFTPSLETTKHFQPGWIGAIYLRNALLLTIVAGGLHLRLYLAKAQGLDYKYIDKWLGKGDKRFLFGSQTWDNIFWNMASGCVIWTAYEALSLWAYSNNFIPYLDFRAHPVYGTFLMFAIIYMRYSHFFFVHWLIHWKPLYNACHYLHHKNINIGPWSGLAMHPLEHLLYFSGVLIHWLIPSHPVHALFHLLHAGISPAVGHSGFHKIATTKDRELLADHYFHYLHHRHFTVNFGVQEVPLDWWFRTHHDGSPEAQTRMLAARVKK